MNAVIVILDERGRPNEQGRTLLETLRDDIDAVLKGHDDNTRMPCRIDLDDHDCCYICNRVQAAMIAAIEVDLP